MSSLPPPPPPPMPPPPGYVSYGIPATSSLPFQRIAGVRRAIVVLLWISLPLQLLTIFDLVRLSRQARRFLDGRITQRAFEDSVRINGSAVVGILVVPIAVLTMVWMYRM